VSDREPGAGRDQHDHDAECQPRESARGEDCVGPRIGAVLARRRFQKEGQRQETTDPQPGAERVQGVERDRAHGVWLDRRGVAGRRQRY
jgi:hypothetical protein